MSNRLSLWIPVCDFLSVCDCINYTVYLTSREIFKLSIPYRSGAQQLLAFNIIRHQLQTSLKQKNSVSEEKKEAAKEAQAEGSLPQVLLADDSFQKVPSIFPSGVSGSLLVTHCIPCDPKHQYLHDALQLWAYWGKCRVNEFQNFCLVQPLSSF